jgi:hypothetical protein
MEREHLIIIALILVALYMMNNDNKDTVKAIGPMGRIRYDVDPFGANCDDGSPPPCREGFMQPDAAQQGKQDFGQHIRYSDKNFAQSQHIKNHIRSRNMNSVFSGMMGTGGQQDCSGGVCE